MKKMSLFSAVLAAGLLFPIAGAAQAPAPPAGGAARKELRELHTQLTKELSAAEINNARVNELKTQIVQKQSALAVARIDQRARTAALLTPEQRQARGERGERMRQRRGPGRNDAQLRQRIDRLERELEELRKKVG